MTPPDEREKGILATALKLPPTAHAAFLDEACAEDESLRQRIKDALQAALATHPPAPERPQANGPRGTIAITLPDEGPGEKPGQLIGRYKLLEKIGEGGMGSVWVAEQQEPLRRKVALKVIKLGMDTAQVIARFEAERQALALMDHPHIAKVFDAGATETGRPFFVMEYVSGIRLNDYCDRHNLATRERLELFIQVCRAIQHAHEKGILHRDIKPPNILVSLHDKLPSPKIIDFGIAKAIGGQRLTERTVYTAFEEFIGTPEYMSPEQAEMNPLGIDARSDVYSLGVVLYELLTGVRPLLGEWARDLGRTEICRIIREEEPLRPSTRLTSLQDHERERVARRQKCDPPKLVHLVRGELDWIVMKCLEKDRIRRYETVNDLAQDLRRYLDGEPIQARPPSTLYGFRKFVRRHRPAFAATLVCLLLTALSALVLVFAWPARPQGGEALLKRADARLVHYDRKGYLEQALTDLTAARNIDPRDHRVWAKLGWAHWLSYEDNERDEVRQDAFLCSSNALRLNPDNSEGHLVQGLVARDQRDWVSATNHLWTAKDLTRSADGIVLVSLASTSHAAGDLSNASLFAQLALSAAANRWDVFNRLGVYYHKAGDSQAARTNLEHAAQMAKNGPLPHRHLGEFLASQRQLAEAHTELETALKLWRSPQALSSLGSVFLARGNHRKAFELFSEACGADPSRYIYRFNAGLALWEDPATRSEATRYFAEALDRIESGLKVGGKKARLRAYRGACLAALSREGDARKDLELALQEAPDDSTILSIVWTGYHLLGDGPRADEIKQLRLKRKK